MLDPPRPDGTIHGRCDRCLTMLVGRDRADLLEQGVELRDDGQAWCLACARDARAVKQHNARGVRRR